MENSNSKRKVLFVVEAMGGGVFTYVVGLVNELVHKYDVYVAYAVRPQTPKDYREYFEKDVHLIKVNNFSREINLLKDLKAAAEIKKIVNKVNPDIVHLHSSKAGVIGRIVLRKAKIPIFYTPHGYSFLMENCSPIKRKVFRAIESICAKCNCVTVSCSYGEHEETLRMTNRAVYINNAIDFKAIDKIVDRVELKEHPFTVFTLGRICFQKNPQLFNQIAEAMPDIKFLWIGEGELHNTLTAKNIAITGWVERETALAYAVNADVFLLPSLWEGMPMSLLESMYMRKPCVVSNILGNNNVIHNCDNGYVCDSKDQFVKAIQEIKNGKAHAYVAKAYKDVLEKYNTQAQAQQYSDLYQMYLEKEKRK